MPRLDSAKGYDGANKPLGTGVNQPGTQRGGVA